MPPLFKKSIAALLALSLLADPAAALGLGMPNTPTCFPSGASIFQEQALNAASLSIQNRFPLLRRLPIIGRLLMAHNANSMRASRPRRISPRFKVAAEDQSALNQIYALWKFEQKGMALANRTHTIRSERFGEIELIATDQEVPLHQTTSYKEGTFSGGHYVCSAILLRAVDKLGRVYIGQMHLLPSDYGYKRLQLHAPDVARIISDVTSKGFSQISLQLGINPLVVKDGGQFRALDEKWFEEVEALAREKGINVLPTIYHDVYTGTDYLNTPEAIYFRGRSTQGDWQIRYWPDTPPQHPSGSHTNTRNSGAKTLPALRATQAPPDEVKSSHVRLKDRIRGGFWQRWLKTLPHEVIDTHRIPIDPYPFRYFPWTKKAIQMDLHPGYAWIDQNIHTTPGGHPRFLDIGASDGRGIALVAEHHQAEPWMIDAHLILLGLDPVLGRMIATEGIGHGLKGDIRNTLPYLRANCFDVTTMVRTLGIASQKVSAKKFYGTNAIDPQATLREIHRVLAPGGQLLIWDYVDDLIDSGIDLPALLNQAGFQTVMQDIVTNQNIQSLRIIARKPAPHQDTPLYLPVSEDRMADARDPLNMGDRPRFMPKPRLFGLHKSLIAMSHVRQNHPAGTLSSGSVPKGSQSTAAAVPMKSDVRRDSSSLSLQTFDVQDPFPDFHERMDSSEFIHRTAKGKFFWRTLLQGGPLPQPSWTLAVLRSAPGKSVSSGGQWVDYSYDTRYSSPEQVRSFEAMASWIRQLIDERRFPPNGLIYKPNTEGYGRGIIVLTLENDNQLVLSMASQDDDRKQFPHTERIVRYIRQSHSGSITRYPDQDLISIRLKPSGQDLVRTLTRIWETVSVEPIRNEEGQFLIYDTGLLEPMVPMIRPAGRAFETRHIVFGNLASGTCDLMKEKSGDDAWHQGWYARHGSSKYFSNNTYRKGSVEKYRTDHTFDLLLERNPKLKARKQEFKEYVDDLLRAEFAYMAARFKAAGIRVVWNVHVAFDLMWVEAPAAGDFPIPVLTEMSFSVPVEEWSNPQKEITSREKKPVPIDLLTIPAERIPALSVEAPALKHAGHSSGSPRIEPSSAEPLQVAEQIDHLATPRQNETHDERFRRAIALDAAVWKLLDLLIGFENDTLVYPAGGFDGAPALYAPTISINWANARDQAIQAFHIPPDKARNLSYVTDLDASYPPVYTKILSRIHTPKTTLVLKKASLYLLSDDDFDEYFPGIIKRLLPDRVLILHSADEQQAASILHRMGYRRRENWMPDEVEARIRRAMNTLQWHGPDEVNQTLNFVIPNTIAIYDRAFEFRYFSRLTPQERRLPELRKLIDGFGALYKETRKWDAIPLGHRLKDLPAPLMHFLGNLPYDASQICLDTLIAYLFGNPVSLYSFIMSPADQVVIGNGIYTSTAHLRLGFASALQLELYRRLARRGYLEFLKNAPTQDPAALGFYETVPGRSWQREDKRVIPLRQFLARTANLSGLSRSIEDVPRRSRVAKYPRVSAERMSIARGPFDQSFGIGIDRPRFMPRNYDLRTASDKAMVYDIGERGQVSWDGRIWLQMSSLKNRRVRIETENNIPTLIRPDPQDPNPFAPIRFVRIERPDGTLVDAYYDKLVKARLDVLDHVIVRGLTTNDAGGLFFGTRTWFSLVKFKNTPVELMIERGLVTSVRFLSPTGDVLHTLEATRIVHPDGNLAQVSFVRFPKSLMQSLDHVTVVAIRLNSKGVLELGGQRWMKMELLAHQLVDADIVNGQVVEVRSHPTPEQPSRRVLLHRAENSTGILKREEPAILATAHNDLHPQFYWAYRLLSRAIGDQSHERTQAMLNLIVDRLVLHRASQQDIQSAAKVIVSSTPNQQFFYDLKRYLPHIFTVLMMSFTSFLTQPLLHRPDARHLANAA